MTVSLPGLATIDISITLIKLGSFHPSGTISVNLSKLSSSQLTPKGKRENYDDRH